MPRLPLWMVLMTTPLGVAVSAGGPFFVAVRVGVPGVSVGVSATVAVLVGGTVAMGAAVPVRVAVPLNVIAILTFPRLHATTVRMIAEMQIRILFVRLVFI